jgi:hypothetical protein
MEVVLEQQAVHVKEMLMALTITMALEHRIVNAVEISVRIPVLVVRI